ncbi:MAG TPA: hypothetical protein VGO40_18245 [Longimicrobium sp.]|jgi:hypothetical protein|nr:hypothetical protein [Longimicrobium sp.]
MTRSAFSAAGMMTIIAAGALAGCSAAKANEDQGRATVAVAVPARAGAVDSTTQNSDEFIWRLLTQFAAPVSGTRSSRVVFETWATDNDVFSTTPHWPSPDAPKEFQRSVLGAMSMPSHVPIDVPCVSSTLNAAVGGFPTTGTPTPCIAEEVKRNRPQFDYIVSNHLNTQTGLAAAFARNFKVAMPTTAISVKGDWIPVRALLQWIPTLGSVANIERLYYTNVSDSVEYALLSLHVSSRQNANWVWGTFEHQMNPGRCDQIGCFDSFGAANPTVFPNRRAVNTQYGACRKTAPLRALMANARLSAVWQSYCLKSTMVDYAAPDGTPYVLGNSVIERIVGNGTVAASSCIGCHVYASFGSNGQPTSAATAMLPYNPTGAPIPAALNGSLQFDFMWGVLLAPK